MSKYLFIEAHADDSILACGGTIAKLKEEGHQITNITLSHIYEDLNLSLEWINAMEIIKVDGFAKLDFKTRHFNTQYNEILQYLFQVQKENYDFVFTHNSTCIHSDHSTVGRICERVFKHTNLITYTHPWNTRGLKQNYFIKLEKQHIEKKIEALKCYESQSKRTYLHPDYTWANSLNTGVVCGSKYAEGFNAVNLIG